ncbi:MAG: SdpI family protein [Dethiobacter sp.]|nr:SdpI family protein [Dethiobacter sp.]MBS3988701.1 SdpI family protein [Dethiobacter sp.]
MDFMGKIMVGLFIGPIILLLSGLLLLLFPPKNRNYIYGYLTRLSSKTQQTWDFANKLAAKLLVGMGSVSLVLAIIALGAIAKLPNNLLERAYSIAVPLSAVVFLLLLLMLVFIVQVKLKKMFKLSK